MKNSGKSRNNNEQSLNNHLTEDIFKEILLQAEPLLMRGCNEFELKERFRNIRAEVISKFVTQATERGIIIKEHQFGTFVLLKPL